MLGFFLQAEIEYNICKCISTSDNGWSEEITILAPLEGSLKFIPHLDASFEIMSSTYLQEKSAFLMKCLFLLLEKSVIALVKKGFF